MPELRLYCGYCDQWVAMAQAPAMLTHQAGVHNTKDYIIHFKVICDCGKTMSHTKHVEYGQRISDRYACECGEKFSVRRQTKPVKQDPRQLNWARWRNL